MALVAVLGVFLVIAGVAERDRLARSAGALDAAATRLSVEHRATADLVAALERETSELQRLANAALDAPPRAAAAFGFLDALRGDAHEVLRTSAGDRGEGRRRRRAAEFGTDELPRILVAEPPTGNADEPDT